MDRDPDRSPGDIGSRLGDFEIVREIGRGGMGVVYEARQLSLQRRVAVKVLPAELTSDSERLRRFEREARILAAVDHPNIVMVHSIEQADRQHFISMELVDGIPLDRKIPSAGMDLDSLLSLAIPVADALSSAHDKGITHRDLKPANVMVSHDGRVKILDFGLAKLRREPVSGAMPLSSTQSLSMTREGTVLGTVPYMSPEQVEGKPVDHRSDLFSLGALIYEMATGARPFSGDTGPAVMSAILRETPAPVHQINPELPEDLGRIVGHCLRKDPERRYQTAKGLRNELEELKSNVALERLASTSGRVTTLDRRRHRIVAVAASAALILFVILIAVGAWIKWGPGSDSRELPQIGSLEARRSFQQGQRYEERGYTVASLRLAERQYRDAIALEPDNPFIQARLANLLVTLDEGKADPSRSQEARSLVDRCLQSETLLADCRLARGRVLLLEGDPEGAVDEGRSVIRLAPEDHRGYVLVGKALIAQGRDKQGVAELKRGVDVGDGHIWARAALARQLTNQGQLDMAAAEYKKVLEYAPDHANSLNNLGAIYAYTGRYVDSIPVFERLLELEPDADAAGNLGTAYYFLGRFKDAAEAYEKAVNLDPDEPRWKRNLGETHELLGDADVSREWYRRAVSDATRALEAGSRSPDVVVDRAFCLAKLGRFAEADQTIGEALSRDPDDMFFLYGAAMVHAIAQDRQSTLAFVRRAIDAGYPREQFLEDPAFAAYADDEEFLSALISN